jgi:hypothetical protein
VSCVAAEDFDRLVASRTAEDKIGRLAPQMSPATFRARATQTTVDAIAKNTMANILTSRRGRPIGEAAVKRGAQGYAAIHNVA